MAGRISKFNVMLSCAGPLTLDVHLIPPIYKQLRSPSAPFLHYPVYLSFLLLLVSGFPSFLNFSSCISLSSTLVLMPYLCPVFGCDSALTSMEGLRRHYNTRHSLNPKVYVCECGMKYLDPARRSRCRGSHLRTYGCPLKSLGCSYTNDRRDSVKSHMRSHHSEFLHLDLPVLVLPPVPPVHQTSFPPNAFTWNETPAVSSTFTIDA